MVSMVKDQTWGRGYKDNSLQMSGLLLFRSYISLSIYLSISIYMFIYIQVRMCLLCEVLIILIYHSVITSTSFNICKFPRVQSVARPMMCMIWLFHILRNAPHQINRIQTANPIDKTSSREPVNSENGPHCPHL